jgi:hypothetical protein
MGPIIIGDVESAQVVTPKTIYETKRDGSLMQKQVWESLDPNTSVGPIVDKGQPFVPFDNEPADFPSPQPEHSYTTPVRI